MRRLALAALLCGALNAIGAQSAPPLVSNERQGYAFEYPRVLAEQRLFGTAHGVALLAESCREVPATAQATNEAYARWHDEQKLQLADLQGELAEFYYGPRAADANWQHIAAALNLREKLDLAPERLVAACSSLPEALRQPRYDLTALFQLEGAIAAMSRAIRVETQATACTARLPAAEREQLTAAYADWQRNEEAALVTARSQLQHYWNSTATPGKPEDWQEAMKQRYSNPPAATCTSLASTLRSSDASLAYSFIPAPTVSAAIETEATEQVNAVSASAPLSVQAADEAAKDAAATTSAEPPADTPASDPVAYLFDLIMKVFDERPHEDAARESGRKPARSQRAYP